MNYEEIQTFLLTVESGSISKAASQLFIGQGTASSRIQNLEEQLKVSLLYRQKGGRNIILTPEGETFLPIAQQFISLWNDASNLKNLQIYRELRIAAVDRINSCLFVDVYKNFMQKHQNINLTLQTEHSTEIHQMIENQQMDLGVVFSLHMFPNVVAIPLYQEKMVFIYHKDSAFATSYNIQDLDVKDEIYLRWSSDFNLWHKQYFPYCGRTKMTLGTVSVLLNFLGEKDLWSIVSESIANIMISRNSDLRSATIPNPQPPVRTAYLLHHKYPNPWVREAMNLFIEDITDFIQNNPALMPL